MIDFENFLECLIGAIEHASEVPDMLLIHLGNAFLEHGKLLEEYLVISRQPTILNESLLQEAVKYLLILRRQYCLEDFLNQEFMLFAAHCVLMHKHLN